MENPYDKLRLKALALKADELGIELTNNEQVYAAVVDINIQRRLVTLVCTFDGSVSVYYSSGEIRIGLGEIDKVRKASISLLVNSGQCLKMMPRVTVYPHNTDYMQLYLLARDGVYKKAMEKNRDGTREERFLEFLVQNVLTAMREGVTE